MFNSIKIYILSPILVLFLFFFVGCASPGSPQITVEKNVYVFVLGCSNEIEVEYTQSSETETEAVIDYLLEANPQLKIPLLP